MGNRIPVETKAAMLADLHAGKGCDQIAVTHGVGRQSVFSLREKHRDELPAWKRRTAARVMEAAGKIVDRINREAESKDASLKDLSICAGILISKQQELSGAPSTIVEHRHTLGEGMAGWVGIQQENTAQSSTKAADVVDIGGKAESIDEMEARKPQGKD
jgi:hypothetical protein